MTTRAALVRRKGTRASFADVELPKGGSALSVLTRRGLSALNSQLDLLSRRITRAKRAFELHMGEVPGTNFTAAATLDASQNVVPVDATSGAITITLPPAAAYPNKEYSIKKVDASNNVTVDGDGSETIDGAATYVLSIQYEVVRIRSTGSEWWVL